MLGKVVESVWVDSMKQDLWFVFADGSDIYWEATGQCCSHCWFEHVEALDFKGTIVDIENYCGQATAPIIEENEYSYIDTYFMTIRTTHGRLLIDMRNSSNGYYGGSVSVVEKPTMWGDRKEPTWTLVE